MLLKRCFEEIMLSKFPNKKDSLKKLEFESGDRRKDLK